MIKEFMMWSTRGSSLSPNIIIIILIIPLDFHSSGEILVIGKAQVVDLSVMHPINYNISLINDIILSKFLSLSYLDLNFSKNKDKLQLTSNDNLILRMQFEFNF